MPRVEIDQQVFERIEIVCPRYLSPTGFINLLLEQHVDSRVTLTERATATPAEEGGAIASEVSKAVSSSKEERINKSKKKVPEPKFVFSVPPDLDFCKADLLEFWREHKSGKKTRRAATLLINGLRAIRDAYGEKAVAEQLELACAYGWENITLANYEKFGLKQAKGGAPAQPEFKHPAGKVFTAKDFDVPRNASLSDLF